MPQIHVLCHRPGMNRGGRANPRHAAYDFGVHTPAQLRELLAEPEVTVLVGDVLTEDYVAAIEQHRAALESYVTEVDPAKADAELAAEVAKSEAKVEGMNAAKGKKA